MILSIIRKPFQVMDTGIAGNFEAPEEFLFPRTEHTYSTFTWSQNEYVTRHQAKNFKLVPLYEVTDETYTVYFTEQNKSFHN